MRPLQVEAGEALVQRAQVVLERAVEAADAADAARARRAARSSASSISASVASESLKPSPPKNLMPLSRYGLCEAESTTPRSNP